MQDLQVWSWKCRWSRARKESGVLRLVRRPSSSDSSSLSTPPSSGKPGVVPKLAIYRSVPNLPLPITATPSASRPSPRSFPSLVELSFSLPSFPLPFLSVPSSSWSTIKCLSLNQRPRRTLSELVDSSRSVLQQRRPRSTRCRRRLPPPPSLLPPPPTILSR